MGCKKDDEPEMTKRMAMLWLEVKTDESMGVLRDEARH
jgi:hypothetical protein